MQPTTTPGDLRRLGGVGLLSIVGYFVAFLGSGYAIIHQDVFLLPGIIAVTAFLYGLVWMKFVAYSAAHSYKIHWGIVGVSALEYFGLMVGLMLVAILVEPRQRWPFFILFLLGTILVESRARKRLSAETNDQTPRALLLSISMLSVMIFLSIGTIAFAGFFLLQLK